MARYKPVDRNGEITNGYSKLHDLQRTLMKDARRELHSLVEAVIYKSMDQISTRSTWLQGGYILTKKKEFATLNIANSSYINW